MARAIKLIDAPVGLFEVDGVLVLKTEYSTRHVDGTTTPDCYIVESGEHFWGGVDSVEERNNLMVTPVEMPALAPQNEPLSIEQLRKMEQSTPVWWDYIPCWVLVRRGSVLAFGSDPHKVENLLGRFYRRPPEGEENA